MTEVIHHYINGRVVESKTGRRGDVYNPAIGEVVRQVAFADAAEVDAAVTAARDAFPAWAAAPPIRRARVMFKMKQLLEDNIDELARLMTEEHGKTQADAKGSITRGFEVVEFACGIPQLLKGEFTEQVGTGVDSFSIRQPLGVCVGITPFNFPAMIPLWMSPIALACGNTFVLKPSEKDPSLSLRLAELYSEAGLPDGTFNVIQGEKDAVNALLAHPDVAAISFVGATATAEYIYHTGCANNKRVQALGGAKNHMVVMPDADMGQATAAIMGAAYGSAGERCMAISVVVTVGDAADRLLPKIQERIAKLKIGSAEDPEAEMGPLITAEHRDKVVSYIDSGVEEGAELVRDGRGLSIPDCENGYFVGPTLFDRVKPDMKIYRDEIFGPVLSVVRTEHYTDALTLVNENPYANGTAIFTNDGGAARRFQREIQVGMVGINVSIPVPLGFYSFGGWKSSLFGAHSIYGPDGVHFYTRPKVVTTRWPDPAHRGVDLGFPRSR